jgi:hypothetical protein
VKLKFGLWVTAAERAAMRRVLSHCPTMPLPARGTSPVYSSAGGKPPGTSKSASVALDSDVYTRRRAERVVMEAIGGGGAGRWSIASWNDEPRRSKDEVIAVLERALRRRVPEQCDAVSLAKR